MGSIKDYPVERKFLIGDMARRMAQSLMGMRILFEYKLLKKEGVENAVHTQKNRSPATDTAKI